MKRKKHSKKKIGIAKTHKAAISLTGIPPHVFQQLKDSGSKACRGNGTVDCDKLLEEAAELPEASTDGELNIYIERAKNIRADRLLKEQRHQERAGQLIPIEMVKREVTGNIITAKKKLYSAEQEIASELSMRGLTAEHVSLVRESVTTHQRNAIKELHAGNWGKIKCPHCKKEIA